MVYKTCAGGCGTPTPPREDRSRVLCEGEDCFKNYCNKWLDRVTGKSILIEDNHLLWARSSKRTPVIEVRTFGDNYKSIRVIDAIRMRNGEEFVQGDIISEPSCDRPNCINPDHHKVRHLWKTKKPEEFRLDRVRLPFGPIQRACTALRLKHEPAMVGEIGWKIPTLEYQRMYDTGCAEKSITFLRADAFCCDVLEVHPIAIYGPELYFQGLGEEAA